MRVTIEPTPEVLTTMDGWRVRLWRGETDSGIAVTALVAAICSDPPIRMRSTTLLSLA